MSSGADEKVQVFGRDDPARDRLAAHPVEQAGPIFGPDKEQPGSGGILPVWISVSDSNSSSSVPKPPGKMAKPSAYFDEHRLAGEEVAELDTEIDHWLTDCSCGSSMLQPIESPPASWQPRFAASMMPGRRR